MNPYSLDTSFLIDVLNGTEAARGTMERLDSASDPLAVTPTAAAELHVGASLGNEDERKRATSLLDSLLWLDASRDGARRAGRIQAELRREGEPIPFTDCLIAGTTLANDARLVSRDTDYDRIDALVVESY